MLYYILFTTYGLIAVALQCTWFSGAIFSDVHLNLILPFVLFAGVNLNLKQALPILILYGLLSDLSTSSPAGLTSASFVVVYEIVRFISAVISIESTLAKLFWLIIISMINLFISNFFMFVFTGNFEWIRIFMGHFLTQAVLDGFTGFFIIDLFRYMSQSISQDDEKRATW